MSFGFEVWDSSGTSMLTITDRLTTFIGSYSFSGNSTTSPMPIVVSVSGINAGGTYFAIGNAGWFSLVVGTNQVSVYWYAIGSFSGTFSVFQM